MDTGFGIIQRTPLGGGEYYALASHVLVHQMVVEMAEARHYQTGVGVHLVAMLEFALEDLG